MARIELFIFRHFLYPVVKSIHKAFLKTFQKLYLKYGIIGLCMRFVLAASIGVFLLSFLGSEMLVGMFAGKSKTVYQLAAEGMKIFSFSFLFSGLNIFISAMFTALSNGKASAFLSFFRTFVLLTGAILILPRFLGITGVWLAAPAAEFTGALFSLGAILKAERKIR